MLRKLFFLWWSFWIAMTIALSLCVARADAALSDCIDATCRITAPDGGRGTGCVFEISDGRVYVLTNAHVATSTTLRLEFWRDGHQSQPLVGTTLLKSQQADAAVVVVDAGAFDQMLPSVIPIAAQDYLLRPGDTILSVGCAAGSWSTGFKGHSLKYSGGDLYFLPTPANGRSGSAIFDAAGEQIVGLLRARVEDGAASHGVATSVQSLYRAFNSRQSATIDAPKSDARPTQCGPNGCPADSSQWRLSPYRSQQDQRDNRQDERIDRLYPTLPPPQYAPMTPIQPPLDIRPIISGLDRLGEGQDRIADLLIEIRGNDPLPAQPVVPPVPVVPVTPPPVVHLPDEEVTKARTVAEAAVQQTQAIQGELEQTQEETSQLRVAINALIGDRESLRERIDQRLDKVKAEVGEDASRREIAGAYVRDFAAERLSGGAGWTLGKVAAGALGLSGPLAAGLAAAGWLASRK
ncbi:MAG TPA: trypsin-like peptidase domain-containing protein, partial [Thermoguttaceae bacterium]|nr:trypsin-like peptidase domain-containing protein [Thermoguttaceae bacterium]